MKYFYMLNPGSYLFIGSLIFDQLNVKVLTIHFSSAFPFA